MSLSSYLQTLIDNFDTWVVFGLFGQSMFFLRFFVQWLVSEREKRSVIPMAFWYFSIAGALIVLAYGVRKADPVLILGQSAGLVVYLRNLWLIYRGRRAVPSSAPQSPG